MGKRTKKRPVPKRRKAKNTYYRDSWISTKIKKGDLDILFTTKEILEELSKNEIYYYRMDYDTLIIVNVNDSKKLIEFSKRGKGVFIKKEREKLFSIAENLPDGINLIAELKGDYTILSSNSKDINGSMWTKEFSYYPTKGIFTNNYKPKHILLKLISYPAILEAKEIFILIEKSKAPLAKIVQNIRTSILYNENGIDMEGLLNLINLITYTNNAETPFKEHTATILESFMKSKEISGRIQRKENKKAKVYSDFLDNLEVGKLMDVVTAPKEKIKEEIKKEEEKIQESILKAAKRIFSDEGSKISVELSSILARSKIPAGHGVVLIDTPDTFYPDFMKKVKNIFYAGDKLVVSIPNEKGIQKENISNIFGIDASLITVFHSLDKEEEK